MTEVMKEVDALAQAIAAELAPLLVAALSPVVSSSRASKAIQKAKKRDLCAEVETFLALGGPRTAPEIARAIRARDRSVREVLRTDGRFIRASEDPNRSGRARLWCLVPGGSGLGPESGTSARNEGQ